MKGEGAGAILSPRRSLQSAGYVQFGNLDDVIAFLSHRREERHVFLTDNPFMSRLATGIRQVAYSRFLNALSEVTVLETLSLQRSFVSDEFLIAFCKLLSDGRFPHLSQLNLNQNLITDTGFVALGQCLSAVADEALLDALQKNPHIIELNVNWRSPANANTAHVILSNRNSDEHSANVESLKTALLEIHSTTPQMKAFLLEDNPVLAEMLSCEQLSSFQSTLSLLSQNTHLNTLKLPGNSLPSVFVELFCNAVIANGAFRNIRFLDLERNCFQVADISKIVSLVHKHHACDEEQHPFSVIPFESLRLAGQQDLIGKFAVEANTVIMSTFVWNQSLIDLTLDVSEEAMEDLRLNLERNRKKQTRLSITPVTPSAKLSPLLSPQTSKRSSTTNSLSAKRKSRFSFSPMSPVKLEGSPLDTIDDIMSTIARDSPNIKDFTLSDNAFLECLPDNDLRKFSRILMSLLSPNQYLHTLALQNCGIGDPFVDALVTAGEKGLLPNLSVINFTRNRLSDEGVILLVESPFSELRELRIRHRKQRCSSYTAILVLNALGKPHRSKLRVFEFDFDHPDYQTQADRQIAETVKYTND
ncbi:unnamed protein product (mitochondrion) [Plasmodiophora brassicae]|uniref:Uncharacterized protein n=1 Tax=Plasmodiophora brassicae TaxID=37360 RepID=A0A3P3Y218_PLABS|nr:unnamed protein product [Plasmodiophora brassicae]